LRVWHADARPAVDQGAGPERVEAQEERPAPEATAQVHRQLRPAFPAHATTVVPDFRWRRRQGRIGGPNSSRWRCRVVPPGTRRRRRYGGTIGRQGRPARLRCQRPATVQFPGRLAHVCQQSRARPAGGARGTHSKKATLLHARPKLPEFANTLQEFQRQRTHQRIGKHRARTLLDYYIPG